MTITTKTEDTDEYLDCPKMIREYLRAAFTRCRQFCSISSSGILGFFIGITQISIILIF